MYRSIAKVIMMNRIPYVDICTLSDYQEDTIMVSRFSDYLKVHQDLVFPHRHSFYHLVFFTKGSGNHSIDFNQFTVKPSQIYFMVPGQVHTWNFGDEVDGYLVNFSEEFFHSFLLKPDYLEQFFFLRGVTEKSVVSISDSTTIKITALFEEMTVASEREIPLRQDLIRLLLLQIFIEIEHSDELADHRNRVDRHNTMLKNFRDLVENNFAKIKLPREYATVLSITPNHLNALCKEHLGLQAGEVIRKRIVLEAKRLLVSTDLAASEIAYQLGFIDNSYFTRFFKKQERISPEEFRKKSSRNSSGSGAASYSNTI
jgi:AraC family transcriptional regulator, transcriptional activator of pobA